MPRYSPSLDGILHQIDGSDDQMRIQDAYLQQFRQVGDLHMDNIITVAKHERIISKVTVNYMQKAYEMRIEQRSPTQQAMAKLYAHYSHVPSWVDFEQLQRGMNVFFKYLPAISTSLFFRSLIAGFCFPGITEVLKETSYLGKNSNKRSGTSNRRLLDTITYVTTNMISAEALKPGGEAWKWGLEVRVIHGKVRHRLLNNKNNKWDTVSYGMPINPEDMSATLLESQAAIQGLDWILPIMSSADKADYIALWRYVG